ncbi:hypothetical protein ABKN59_009756 [Abortiporus biennis]
MRGARSRLYSSSSSYGYHAVYILLVHPRTSKPIRPFGGKLRVLFLSKFSHREYTRSGTDADEGSTASPASVTIGALHIGISVVSMLRHTTKPFGVENLLYVVQRARSDANISSDGKWVNKIGYTGKEIGSWLLPLSRTYAHISVGFSCQFSISFGDILIGAIRFELLTIKIANTYISKFGEDYRRLAVDLCLWQVVFTIAFTMASVEITVTFFCLRTLTSRSFAFCMRAGTGFNKPLEHLSHLEARIALPKASSIITAGYYNLVPIAILSKNRHRLQTFDTFA